MKLLAPDTEEVESVATWTPGENPALEIKAGREEKLAIEKKRDKLSVVASPQPPFVYYDPVEGCTKTSGHFAVNFLPGRQVIRLLD